MKISKILLETILPITIGALFLIGYFFISDKLFREPELESCEIYDISNTVYLTYLFVIIILSCLYQITLGKLILKKYEKNYAPSVLNSLVFGIFFTVIFIIINLFQRKMEWDFYPIIFLALFLLGLLFSVLIKICQKIFRNKFVD